MSYEPDYVPPPPSQGASPKQVAAFVILGLTLAGFVLIAFNESPQAILEVGAFLIILGLVFGVGLVSRVEIVQYITAGIMMFGGGIAIGLALQNEQAFWYVGAALFFLCSVIIVIKDRFLDADTSS